MPGHFRDYILNIPFFRRMHPRRIFQNFHGMSSYRGLNSSFQEDESQYTAPGNPWELYERSDYSHAAQESSRYLQDAYDEFEAPPFGETLRGPKVHVRDHEIDMMRQRLCELHDNLHKFGFTVDTDMDDVPGPLRGKVGEIFRERDRIASNLGELSVDILQVEKEIEEQRMPTVREELSDHIDLEAFMFDRALEEYNGVDQRYCPNIPEYNIGTPQDEMSQMSPQAGPDDFRGMPEGYQGVFHEEMACNEVWDPAAMGMDTAYFEEDQREIERQEMRREERPMPGPFDMPGGLENLL